MPNQADIQPSVDCIVHDPHHDQASQWAWHDGLLWHRTDGESKWTIVKRISFTRKRILAIASILPDDPYL